MQENSRYAVGIDIGTTMVRCVVGHLDPVTGAPTIIGVGQHKNSGMRKGSVANLTGPAQAIDDALGEAERMSGYQVNEAVISINGAHILSTKADGMIAVGGMDHEISQDDLARIEDVATVGKVPANRQILEVVPHSYRLDGQENIKNPLGMTGTRLEISANVISALTPHVDTLSKAAENVNVTARAILPSVMAAARATLAESQMENGVVLIDLGGATTSLAIYEEGELQHLAVIPVGGMNVTNDLAIGLKTDPEVAEIVKLEHGSAVAKGAGTVKVVLEKEPYEFDQEDVDEIIEARLEELFESINKELKKAGRAGKLPSGAVLVGGGSKLKGLADFAKNKLGLAVRTGKPTGFGGVAETAEQADYAAAVGLMLLDGDGTESAKSHDSRPKNTAKPAKKTGGFIKDLFDKFKA